jgi:seryl-tRNA synthetase
MLDIKALRSHPEETEKKLQRRNEKFSIQEVLQLDDERRTLLQEEETLRNERNALNKELGQLKKVGACANHIIEATRGISERVKRIELEKDAISEKQNTILMNLPNLPDDSVPAGKSEDENVELRRWGCEFKQRPMEGVPPHWETGVDLNWLDFERGVKLAESRFSVFRGQGALMLRGLTRFMLDLHTTQHGYEELALPLLVNEESMKGTGQLPKFGEDMYRMADDDLYLIPTSEVPMTNLYRDEILEFEQLPVRFTSHTPCFRREAGSAGRDTRGLIRQHQFDKVELVQVTTAEESFHALEALTSHAEAVLQALKLPYRVVALCTGDLGFSATKTYDLEVWMPEQGVYREISSCSNTLDFQARRMNMRYRPENGSKPQLCHTLNGSGIAVGRTVAAILENYRINPETLIIPEVLRPYMHGLEQVNMNN